MKMPSTLFAPRSLRDFTAVLRGWLLYALAMFALLTASAHAQVNNAAFVRQTVQATMTAGQTYAMSVTMKNVGDTTWSAATMYKLGAQNPAGNTTWRVPVELTAAVAPGQEYTFSFPVVAPKVKGAYNAQWKMVKNTTEWFGATTPNSVVAVNGLWEAIHPALMLLLDTVPAIDDAAFVSQAVPSSMTVGQTYNVSVTMKNTGTTIWTSGNGYRLGTQNPARNTTFGGQIDLGSVAPGEQKTFTFAVTAPATTGTYQFQRKMVRNETNWFGTAAPNVPVTVTAGSSTMPTITAPANNAVYVAPAAIALTATGGAGTIATVQFYQGTTLIGSATAAPYTVNWTGVASGSYSITAKATDSAGVITTSAPISVNVISNSPPTVSLTATPANATVGATISLTATAADSDGSIVKVEFLNGGAVLGTTTIAPYTYSWTGVATGSYSVTARATDNLGAGTVSAAVPVTVGAVTSATSIYYIHTDHLNTPRLISDAASAPVWKWDSDPFGIALPNENPSSKGSFAFNPRFPGQYFDRESNLHYNYFRDYDPATGRYVQSDPIGLNGGLNTYAYVGGNPNSRTDPLGLIDLEIPGASGQFSVHGNPGPAATSFRPEHLPPHVHIGANDGPRISSITFQPISKADEMRMNPAQKKFCENLSAEQKSLIKKRSKGVFKFGGFSKVLSFIGVGITVLTADTFQEMSEGILSDLVPGGIGDAY